MQICKVIVSFRDNKLSIISGMDVNSHSTIFVSGEFTFEVFISEIQEANVISFDEAKVYPITLFENREYYFLVESKHNLEALNDYIFKIIGKEERGKYLFLFSSKNYVGILNLHSLGFDATCVEVASLKIDYASEYNKLLGRIAELGLDLLSRSSSVFELEAQLSQKVVNDDMILNSKIAYLRSFILSGELNLLYGNFLRKPHSKIVNSVERKPVWEISDFNLNDLESFISDSSFNNGAIIFPEHGEEVVYEDIIDTVENRFLKYVLKYVLDYLKIVIEFLQRQGTSILLVSELESCSQICMSLLASPIFVNISDLTYFPSKSNVLQNKYPYKEIYHFYWFLSSTLELSDESIDKSIKLPQKDLPKLYEYWCYLRLLDILSSKYPSLDLVSSGFIKYEPSSLSYVLSPSNAKVSINVSGEKTLIMYYNKSYSSKNFIFNGRSYSHTLTPDISIELFRERRLLGIMHMDSKYRLEKMSSFKEEDIDKMHTYKDSILGSVGAFVLYPGEISETFKQADLKDTSLDIVFPAVGAFHLNIEETLSHGNEGREILKIIEQFINIDVELSDTSGFEKGGRNMNYLKRLLD